VFAGGLTWLWLDAPYVITARKLFNWAVAENDKGNPFPVGGRGAGVASGGGAAGACTLIWCACTNRMLHATPDTRMHACSHKTINCTLPPNPTPPQIHGTCLGHQLLHILASNVSRNDLLVETDAVAHATTLDFTPAAATSRTLGGLPEDLRAKLADPTLNIAMENHEVGGEGGGCWVWADY
jgi:hypothetical protein